jgi:hypothetical protein
MSGNVAGINQKIKAIYSLYDAELSEPKSFMIAQHFRRKEICLGGIKFVNSHRILGIDLSLSGAAHSFERTAVQSHTQVSSDDSEAHFDPKPTNSAAGPVPALEAVEASGLLARALQ